MEAGLALDTERVDRFIMSLRPAGSLIVAEGLLHRPLRNGFRIKKSSDPAKRFCRPALSAAVSGLKTCI